MSDAGQPCSICVHDLRSDVDALLLVRMPLRDIAGQFGVSRSALSRHRKSCIPEVLARAAASADAVTAASLVAEIERLRVVTLAVLNEARSKQNHHVALAAIARLEKQAELIGKLAGELVERRQVHEVSVVVDAHWLALRDRIVRSLSLHPVALLDVLAALSDVERLV